MRIVMDVAELKRRIAELGLRFGTLPPRFDGPAADDEAGSGAASAEGNGESSGAMTRRAAYFVATAVAGLSALLLLVAQWATI